MPNTPVRANAISLSRLMHRAHAEARSGRRLGTSYRERFRSALRRAWRDARVGVFPEFGENLKGRGAKTSQALSTANRPDIGTTEGQRNFAPFKINDLSNNFRASTRMDIHTREGQPDLGRFEIDGLGAEGRRSNHLDIHTVAALSEFGSRDNKGLQAGLPPRPG